MNNIILNTKYKPKLIFLNKIFYCTIGKNGIVPAFKKKEGDGSTPMGKWKIGKVFFRRDKFLVSTLKNRFLKLNAITKTCGWCDDPRSSFYNKFLKIKKHLKQVKYSYERLFMNENEYDFIIEIEYNNYPIIKGKGSAIFMHCIGKKRDSTLGCIGLNKNNLIFLINNLKRINYITIK